jgi:CRISPR-associated protein Cmr3
MRIFIEPTEPLLFRTGRPFNAGESNFAETIFPPTPETLQGALRAMIAVQWGKAQKDKARTINEIFNESDILRLIGRRVGDRNIYGQFRITGLTLGWSDEKTKKVNRLFPMPTHIIQATVKDGDKKTTIPVRLIPKSISQEMSNHPPGKQLLFPELGGKKTAGKSEAIEGWLTAQGLQRALSKTGLPDAADIVPAHQIYERESRLGIGMNNATKTTEEGYLYQVQMIRMQPHYGFVVDIHFGEDQYGDSELPQPEQRTGGLGTPPELAFLKEGWLTLGGEQRAARFEILEAESVAAEQSISQTTPGRLLYFATPTYFKNGWLPATSGILPAKPITAAINRYQPIGGWLLNPGNAGGASKITRRCVPAGSVYFFDEEVPVTQALTEYGWQIGYGIAYTGEY